MNKVIRNVIISGTVIGAGAALIKLNRNKKKSFEAEAVEGRRYYQLGEEKSKRNYITLYEVNKDKIEKISEELEDVKEKKKTM